MAQNDPFSPYPDPFSIDPTLSSASSAEVAPKKSAEAEADEDKPEIVLSEVSKETFSSEEPLEEPFLSPRPETDFDEEEEAKKVVIGLVVGIILILVLGGVGVWYFLSRDSEPKEDVVTPTPGSFPLTKPQEPKDPNLLLAAVGGKIVTADGFEVIVPAGALSKDMVISVEKVSQGDVTDLFRVKPEGTKFLKPVTLRVPYKESGLLGEETPLDIQLKYWLHVGAAKRNLQFSVDRSEKKLSTQVREI